MDVILLLAPIQAFFLFSLLAAKPGKSLADKVLMAWLGGIGIHTLIYFLHFQYQLSLPSILNLNAAFPFLQGPFLLAYVATLVGLRQKFSRLDYLHLIPFAGFVLYTLFLNGIGAFAPAAGDSALFVNIFALSTLLSFWLLVSVPFYIVWSLLVMHRASRVLPKPVQSRKFRWIWAFVVSLGAVWLVTMAAAALGEDQLSQPHMIFWALTLVVYVLGYVGLTRSTVFTTPEFETLTKELQSKYQKSGLKPDDAKNIHSALIAHVDNDKAFLDAEVSLQGLAQELGYSTNHISQVINEFEQCNFRDFINARRVAEACHRLQQAQDSNLLNLAMAVGFNSKSSFNRAFVKFAGVPPSEYASSL